MSSILLDQGFDVFMLDWGVPDERDADNSFETYVDEYMPPRHRSGPRGERRTTR